MRLVQWPQLWPSVRQWTGTRTRKNLTCVASLSANLFREQKNWTGRGGGGERKKVSFCPLPLPEFSFFFFSSRSSLCALTRAETFVAQAKKNQFDNKEQDLLAQSVVFGNFKRLDTIQVEPSFLILGQEEKKKPLLTRRRFSSLQRNQISYSSKLYEKGISVKRTQARVSFGFPVSRRFDCTEKMENSFSWVVIKSLALSVKKRKKLFSPYCQPAVLIRNKKTLHLPWNINLTSCTN